MEIKFAETLERILKERGTKETRKLICSSLDISQSVVTQYITKKSTPRLPVLAALADLLNVDLGYLVFGQINQQTGLPDLLDFTMRMENSISSIHGKLDNNRTAAGRLISLLIEKIDETAIELSKEYGLNGGLIHDNELMSLEEFSEQTIIIRTALEADISYADSAITPYSPSSRFAPLVARNLAAGRRYLYILPAKSITEQKVVLSKFLSFLTKIGLSASCRSNCIIGFTKLPLVAGCCLYGLDLERLQVNRPDLLMRYKSQIVNNGGLGWLGCTLPPSSMLQANPLMDATHLQDALEMAKKIKSHYFKRIGA